MPDREPKNGPNNEPTVEPVKKPIKFTRRQFLTGAALTAAALLVGCEPTPSPISPTEKPDSSPKPTGTPRPTTEPSPTREATPQPTPTETITQYPKVTLSEEYLKRGFGAIGGEEIVGPTPEPNNPYKFSNVDDLFRYSSEVFGKAITIEGIKGDPALILDVVAAMSLGSNVNYGVVGLGDVKDQNDKYLFEGLRDWKVWTGLMGRILGEPTYQLPKEQALPREFTVREGTKLSIIGQAGQDQVLVLLSEYFDRSTEEFTARKVPRGWYVVLPGTLPEDIEGLSLQRLLRGVGADFDAKAGLVSFKEGN